MARITVLAVLTMASAMSAVAAQSSFVLPKHYAKNWDSHFESHLLSDPFDLPVHLQHAYDAADFPLSAGLIREIAFRRINYSSHGDLPAGTTTMTVRMGFSPLRPGEMSQTFATNLATRVQTVFTGTMNWPKVRRGVGIAPFTHKLPLTKRYAFVRSSGRSFVVDYRITASNYRGQRALDAGSTGIPRYAGVYWQPRCLLSTGKSLGGKGYAYPHPGKTWWTTVSPLLRGTPVLWTLSAYGRSNRGPWPLPLDLTALGAPNCSWDVGLELGIWIPSVASQFGDASIGFVMPWEMAGRKFSEQALVVDLRANSLGLVPTPAMDWQVAVYRGGTIFTLRDTANSKTAKRWSDEVVVVRIQ